MNQHEIEAKVKEIIESELGFKPGQVNKSDRFIEDLGADSLDLVEIAMHLEEAFTLDIPDEAWDSGDKTVQQMIDYVVKKKIDPPRY